MATPILPSWLVRDLEAWLTCRPTGRFAIDAREGKVTSIERSSRGGEPLGEYAVPPPCPRCGGALVVLDNGRRFRCAADCNQVWTEMEYRTLVNEVLQRKRGDAHGQEEDPAEAPEATAVLTADPRLMVVARTRTPIGPGAKLVS